MLNKKEIYFLFFVLIGIMPRMLKAAIEGYLLIYLVIFLVICLVVYIYNEYFDPIKRMERYFRKVNKNKDKTINVR